MALTTCKECGHQISTDAEVCPGCGSKPPKRTSKFTWFVAAVFGIPFVMAIANTSKDSGSSSSPTQAVSLPIPRAPEWQFNTYNDPTSGRKGSDARIESNNTVAFGFPYAGQQRGTLEVDLHPRWGRRVIFSIPRGQIICHVYECSVSIRFDSGPVERYTATAPADYSSTAVFIQNYARFIGQAKKAKRVYIELTFYQEGGRTFEFNAEGFVEPVAVVAKK